MKQLLVALIAALALLGAPTDAEAVFTKFLIDEFDEPVAPPHASMAGMTRAAGGAGGAILPITTTDIASDRGLAGRAPFMFDPGALVVDPSDLEVRLAPGEGAGVDWDVGGFDFATALAPNLVLAGVTNLGLTPAIFSVGLDVDGAMGVDSVVVALAPGATVDVNLAIPGGPITFLGLLIGNIGPDPMFLEVGSVVANPEPTTMALIGLGVLGGAIGYRRRSQDDDVPIDRA